MADRRDTQTETSSGHGRSGRARGAGIAGPHLQETDLQETDLQKSDLPKPDPLKPDLPKEARRALRLTWLGLWGEALWRSFWPGFTLAAAGLGAALLFAPSFDGFLVYAAALWGVALLMSVVWGGLHLQRPTAAQALARLDAALPGRPLAALHDHLATGTQDAATQALWARHQARMLARSRSARAIAPDLRIARLDPYGLRFAAATCLAVGFLFGTSSQFVLSPGTPGAPAGQSGFSGPRWEGWITPPRYTGLPTRYLNEQDEPLLRLPQGSEILLRFYGEDHGLRLEETISPVAAGPALEGDSAAGAAPASAPASAPKSAVTSALQETRIEVARSGVLAVHGPASGLNSSAGGQSWQIALLPDQPPAFAQLEEPTLAADGTMEVAFSASDDYGVVGGEVRIALDLEALDLGGTDLGGPDQDRAARRHGLRLAPDPRDDIVMPLPLTLAGDRRAFSETFVEQFSKHAWANLPVVLTFTVSDDAGQLSAPVALRHPLLAQRFFDPTAAALIEQRRDLLWARANGPRVAQILRTLIFEPEELFPESGHYLQIRMIQSRLEAALRDGPLAEPAQTQIAEALWALALQLEHGDVGDALERMRQAQERLSQAMREGASDEEIAQLMQELRDATQDYLRQLSRQAEAEAEDLERGEMPESGLQLSQDDLQAMMDRIQELMEQGRMAEAEQALAELQQLLENMQVTQGGPGGEGQSAGEQAMEGLSETLREQQGLSDQAFRDLQEQFNPNARRGQSQGNEGRNGGQGRGQSHDGGAQEEGSAGEGSAGEGGDGEGQPRAGSEGPEQGPDEGGSAGGQSLAQRQQQLERELQRQRDGLPLAGPEAEATRRALDQAGRAMGEAAEALREGNNARAIDRQAEAMESLRDGMRALGEAMAQQQGGQQPGDDRSPANRQGNAMDPLGRSLGGQGGGTLGRDTLQDGQANRRAWDLMEEIRRRAGETDRPLLERDYLRRLLDRFQ